MALPAVQPKPGVNSVVALGGSAVVAIDVGPDGGWITNPLYAADQGLGIAEELYVDIVQSAQIGGFGTTFRLEPGQTFVVVPGQITQTSVNAPTSGHRFTVISWNQV